MFGKLTLDAFKHEWIQMVGVYMILVPLAGIIAFLFFTQKWRWLWKEWLTSLDPKKIGVMYGLVSTMMLLKGFSDAALMRTQQVLAVGDSMGMLSANHFQQIFTAHGTAMIFFVAMGFLFCFMNLIIPLQIGARDVAFPFLNAISFWLFAIGGGFLMLSMIVGSFSIGGWVGYPPLTGLQYSPSTGVDYWIWSVQISGAGSLLSGINFFVTILKMRCPGMNLMKMPLFTWSAFSSAVLILFAFPILTVTLALLSLDRTIGTHFFTSDFGGNPMMYVNLIWAWGHPEVYILILPAFGIFSEVVPTFCKKRLFGYVSMVWAMGVITILSFVVWLHHFFTMGAGAKTNTFFGIMTMLIAIPTGVKIFNWLFTMCRGKIQFKTPMLWFLGFVFIFSTGGLTGVLMSVAPIDFQTHNSLFLIAHFHSMVIGGVLFGFLSGVTYWFPKIFGYRLEEKYGRYGFYCWFGGFLLAFMPLYVLGLMGATRRLNHYAADTGWHPLFVVAALGMCIIGAGIGFQVLQMVQSIRNRDKNRDVTGDPWNGRTLEWAISSPPPEYNFAVLPKVDSIDPFWQSKEKGEKPVAEYQDIHLPKNSSLGLWIGIFSFFLGFGAIWQIHWSAAIGTIGIIVVLIIRLSEKEVEFTVPAAEVAKIEKAFNQRKG